MRRFQSCFRGVNDLCKYSLAPQDEFHDVRSVVNRILGKKAKLS